LRKGNELPTNLTSAIESLTARQFEYEKEGNDDDDNSFFSLVFGGGGQRQKTDRAGDEQGRVEEDEGKEEVESAASKLVVVAGEKKSCELDFDEGGSRDDGANDVDDSTQFIEKVIQQRLKKRDSSNGTADTIASTSNSSSSSTSLPPRPGSCARTTTTTTTTSSGNSSAQSSRNPRHVVDPRLQVRYDNRGGPCFKAQADSLIMIRGRGGVIVRAEHVVAGAVNVPAADFYGRVEQRRGRLIFDQMHSHAAVDLVSAVVEPLECSPALETNHDRVPTVEGTDNGGRRRPSKRSRQQQSSQGTSAGSSQDDHRQHHHHSRNDAHKTPKKVVVGSVNIGAAQRRFWLMIVSLAIFLNFLLVMGATAMGLFLSGNLPGQRPKADPKDVVPAPTPTVVVVVTTAGPVATPHPSPVTNAPSFAAGSLAGSTVAALGNMTMAPSSSPPPSSLFPNITMTDDGNMPSFGPETTRNETSSSGGGPTHIPTMAPVDASKTSAPTMPTDDAAGKLAPTWIALLAGGSVILEAAIVALLLLLHRRWKESNKVLPAPFDDDPEATRACSEPVDCPATTTTEVAAVNAPRDSDDDDDENDGEEDGEDEDYAEDSYTFL
jgi:hypothetical protein